MQSFTISPPPGDPPMLQDNTGKVVFTVTNTATRTVDGTVLVKPQPPAVEGWFSFAEGATRTYQPGAVQSVAATVTVPPDTPSATYTFRLDIKAEDNPDEDYTEGPSAQFVVAAAPKPDPWWKRYWWIAVIAAVVLIGIVIAVLLLSGDDKAQAKIPERNCVPILPGTASIDDTPVFGIPRFTVSAGDVGLGKYASQDEAQRVVQLANAFQRRCLIGTVEYWLDETGQPLPPPVDCVGYNRDSVEVQQTGGLFVVRDPQVTRPLGTVASQADANDLKKVAEQFSTRCFIGQGEVARSQIKETLDKNPRGRSESLIERFLATSTMDYWVR